MMMSCKQMTHLISQGLDRELSRRERMTLSLHLMMCRGCTNFRDNMQFLHKACHRLADGAGARTE